MNRSSVCALVLLFSCVDPDGPRGGGLGGGSGGGGPGGGPGVGGGSSFHHENPFGCSTGFGGSGGAAGAALDATPPVIPARQPPPISGGTLAVMADETVVAADSDRDELWILPSGSMTPIRVPLSEGDEPGRVIEGPAGRAFVALRGAAGVAELDVAARRLAAVHRACRSPRGLAWLAAESVLAVACATGELTKLRLTDGMVTSSVTAFIADDLRDVVPSAGGLLLSTFRSAKLIRVDAANTPLSTTRVASAPSSEARVAWRTVQTAKGPLVLHQQQTLLAITTGCGAGYGSQGFSGVTPVTASLARGSIRAALPRELTVVVDVAASADGQNLAVASAGSKAVALLTLENPQAAQVVFGVGQPVAVAYRGTTLVVQSREPSALYLVGAFKQQIMLSTVSRKGTGHDLFHVATNSGIACASCHPEAGDDGHVWSLPEGVRRTPTLRGGLRATAPFHWDGAFKGMTELVSEIMVRRMGGSSQTPERVDALLGWMESVPKVAAPPVDAAAAARGEALFASSAVGCAACHVGALGTNNQTMAVGTGPALQVPRLVELAARAPYFHDGRVPTLAARFGPLGGDAHGNISTLSAEQIADLVTYLLTR